VTEELQTVYPQDDNEKAAYPLVRGGFNFCDDSASARSKTDIFQALSLRTRYESRMSPVAFAARRE